MSFHSWQPCTACRHGVGVPPAFRDEAHAGGIVVCTTCGHAMKATPAGPDPDPATGGPWVLADLTAAEAALVERHAAFPRIRAQQDAIVRQFWG